MIGEIKNYMQFLHGAQNIWIMGNADSCFGKYDEKDLPYPLTSVKSSGQYIISHSCNEGHEYLLVFNASYKQSNGITLNFKDKVQRIGDQGELIDVENATSFTLTPGNIAIFKLN